MPYVDLKIMQDSVGIPGYLESIWNASICGRHQDLYPKLKSTSHCFTEYSILNFGDCIDHWLWVK